MSTFYNSLVFIVPGILLYHTSTSMVFFSNSAHKQAIKMGNPENGEK